MVPRPLSSTGSWPHIAGYRIEGVLGSGGTGVVYRAVQLSVEREVALKVMHPQLLRNTRSILRLQREARTAARLTHPNLISAIDMGETAGTWWFAMELVHGESLAERLERGRLTEEQALEIFIKLSQALEHAREKGVVHRDIKPANILLEEDGNPLLVDLGLARVADDPLLTRSGATLGTPHYISPEQARNPSLADIRSDLWSLGATFFHTVCGRPPFGDGATAEILSGVLYGAIANPAELRPELSSGLVLILRKCLSRGLDRRYHTPAELLEDLLKVQAGKAPAIRASSLEPLDPEAHQAGRGRWFRRAALAALALAALFVWHPWRAEETLPEAEFVAADRHWPALSKLKADFEARALSSAEVRTKLESLKVEMPAGARPEWEALRVSLHQQLERSLHDFYAVSETEFARLIEAHEFSFAEEYITSGLGFELALITGYAGATLPNERDIARFQNFKRIRTDRLAARRQEAQDLAARHTEQWARSVHLPRIESLLAAGEWNAARALLNRGVRGLSVDSGADTRGLDFADLEHLLADLALELEIRAQRLELDWFQLDSRHLRRAVEELAASLAAALEARAELRVGEAFEEGFEGLLQRAGLTLDELIQAPEQRSLEAYERRQRELLELGDELLDADADARLAECEELAQPYFAARRYDDLLEFWRGRRDEPVLQPRHDTLALRIEEARALAALQQRIVLSVLGQVGREIAIRHGGIEVSGEVESLGDPLERGFRLRVAANFTRDYALRAAPGVSGEVLETGALKTLAWEYAGLPRDLGLSMQLALLCYYEGDFAGAADLLASEPAAEAENLLVYDLGLRVNQARGDAKAVLAGRREQARIVAARLTASALPVGDMQRASLKIASFLRKFGDVIDAPTRARLVARREVLEGDNAPSTLEDFEEHFGAAKIRFWSRDKVGLGFSFDDREVGTWHRGDWKFNGQDSWRSPQVASLKDLEGARVPTLLLRDPLLLDRGTMQIILRLRQPADSPPSLLMISAVGFHIACVGPLAGRPPLLLVDTTSLADVALRARSGEGRPFAGLAAGAEHTLVLQLARASGKARIRINAVDLQTATHLSPRDQPQSASLSLRALEPIELISVEIEGTRR